jgi:hypothetical protein
LYFERNEELMRISQRDEAILRALCRKIRLLSLEQIARHWWPDVKHPQQSALRRLRELVRAGWMVSIQPQARGLPPIKSPVVCWNPGQPDPAFDAVAKQLMTRWTTETCRVQAFVLGPAADRYFGVSRRGRLKYDFQATHDLGVSEVFLNLLDQRPALAERWIGEDELAPFRQHEKLPDAVVADGPLARPELVLEFGGAYDVRRVAQFHEDCATQMLPYEIW